jgi:hypothetical protein
MAERGRSPLSAVVSEMRSCAFICHSSRLVGSKLLHAVQQKRASNPYVIPLKTDVCLGIYKYSVCTSQKTHSISISVLMTNQLMLFGKIIAVCSGDRTVHINTLCG